MTIEFFPLKEDPFGPRFHLYVSNELGCRPEKLVLITEIGNIKDEIWSIKEVADDLGLTYTKIKDATYENEPAELGKLGGIPILWTQNASPIGIYLNGSNIYKLLK